MIDIPDRNTDDWYHWSERAAIREFDGDMDRETAETLATEDLERWRETTTDYLGK